MKIKLNSDFTDYYDHWFCRSDERPDFVFERCSRSGLSRSKMFYELEKLGFKTPQHGKIKNLSLEENDYVVVYFDEYSHQGKDKIIIYYNYAYDLYPEYFGTQFLNEGNGFSFRLLKIGNLFFKLSYSSKDDWRSNVGNVKINLFNYVCVSDYFKFNHPLVAVDYILHKGDKYAFDLNISPLIKYTGIEDIISSKDIYKEIEEYIFNYMI